MERVVQAPEVWTDRRGETMLAPQEVHKMLALQALGWGAKRISRELGCSRNAVREYLRRGPDGQFKFPHPWPPQIPPGKTAGL